MFIYLVFSISFIFKSWSNCCKSRTVSDILVGKTLDKNSSENNSAQRATEKYTGQYFDCRVGVPTVEPARYARSSLFKSSHFSHGNGCAASKQRLWATIVRGLLESEGHLQPRPPSQTPNRPSTACVQGLPLGVAATTPLTCPGTSVNVIVTDPRNAPPLIDRTLPALPRGLGGGGGQPLI